MNRRLPEHVDSLQTWQPSPANIVRERRSGKALLWGVLLAAVPFLVLLSRIPDVGPMFLVNALILATSIAMIAAVLTERTFLARTKSADRVLVANPADPNERLVDAYIEVDGLIRGSDRGILWFDTTALYFLGHRTWFVVPRDSVQDLRKRNIWPTLLAHEFRAQSAAIKLLNQDSDIRIGFVAVKELQIGLVVPESVPLMLYRFVSQEPSTVLPDIDKTLPPLAMDPEFAPREPLLRVAFAGIIFFGGMAYLHPGGAGGPDNGNIWRTATSAMLFIVSVASIISAFRFIYLRGKMKARPHCRSKGSTGNLP